MKHDQDTTRNSEESKASDSRPTNRGRNRILVVDDDPSVREMLTRVLVGEGYFVRAAANDLEALDMVVNLRMDLMLLDLNLPGKSGWSIYEQLTGVAPLMSVIIITAQPNQLFTALSAGAGALLEKPLDFPRLLQTVSSLLAEPPSLRLARKNGHRAEFHYQAGRAENHHK